jgi:hypothetical protein
MALARVQTTPRVRGTATATVAITFTTPPAVGNALVIPLVLYQASGTISTATLSCADNRGNSYTLAVLEKNGQIGGAIFVCSKIVTAGGPFTVTVTQTSSSYFETCGIEISGIGTGLAVNRTVTQIGIGTALAAGTTAALTADEALVVGVCTISTNQTAITVESVTPAWAQAFENLDHSASIAGEADSRIRTGVTGTTQTCAWTASTGAAWAAALAAFAATAPALVTVPNVVGLTQAAATTALTAAGLVTTVTTAPHATVAVGLVISTTPASGASVAPGSTVTLVVSSGPGHWKLTIGGVDKTAVVKAFSMTLALNDRARARVTIAEQLPTRYAELMAYAADGVTPIFGGLILQRQYVGRTQANATFTAELECGDWFTYADWVYTSASYAVAVSLKTVLADLIATHLSQYGITLDPAQVVGPTLAPFAWVDKRAADALRELSDRTGYVVRISPTKALRMFQPMTASAPFSVTEAATHCRDVTWRDSDQTPYNAVSLRVGPDGLSEVDEEKHYGDGVRRRWKLYAPFSQIIGGLITGSDATGNDPGGYNVGIFGEEDIPWTVDLATNEVVQRADQALRAVGEYFLIWYTAAFPFTVRVSTGATPVVEYAETRPDVRSEPVAFEIANGLLASFQAAPRELSMTTDVDGLDPGQALTVDLPTLRGVHGTFLVTSVSLSIAFDRVDGRLWRYGVEAVESALYQGSYLDDWRKIAGLGSGSSGSVTGGGGTSGTLTPHHATHETGGSDEVLFPSGLKERGRTVPLGEWTAYTSTWLGQTANPAIGNGFLQAKYTVIGKAVHVQIIIGCGSTTTYGTGIWGFTLPLPVVGHATGTVWIYDGGSGVSYVGTLGSGAFVVGGPFADAVLASVSVGATAAFASATVPIAWASRVPSYIFLQGTYEIA